MACSKRRMTSDVKNAVRQLTELTWAIVVVWRQLITITTGTVVAVVRVNAHLGTFSIVEIAFVHRAARFSTCRNISYSYTYRPNTACRSKNHILIFQMQKN